MGYDGLSDFLISREIYLDENEVSSLINIAIKQHGYNYNKGIRVSRIADNPREKAFHDQWIKENEPNSWVNSGQGILQDLFIESDMMNILSPTKVTEVITIRDRKIVATIIQWLGSNVGFCFLQSALALCGYKIVKSDLAIDINTLK